MSNNLKSMRIKKGITQRDLAKSIGVSQAMLSCFENNKKNLSAEHLVKLADLGFDFYAIYNNNVELDL